MLETVFVNGKRFKRQIRNVSCVQVSPLTLSAGVWETYYTYQGRATVNGRNVKVENVVTQRYMANKTVSTRGTWKAVR